MLRATGKMGPSSICAWITAVIEEGTHLRLRLSRELT